MATIREAFEYAAKNPNSDFANNLKQLAASGSLDVEARKNGIDLTPFKPAPQVQQQPSNTNPEKSGNVVKDFAHGAYKGAASTISNIESGGQKVLDAITKPVSEAITGKPYQATPTLNQTFEGTDKIVPTNTAQNVGFGLEQLAEYAIPGTAGLKVGKGASLATKMAVGAVEAGGITAAQGGSGTDTGVASVIGAISPILGLASKLFKSAKTAEQAVGQIAQGTTKDIPVFKRALDLVETKGVKTFEDLKGKFSEVIPKLATQVDNELAKDTGVYTLSQLALKAKNKAGQEITTDYVGRGLSQLSELYGKIGDDVAKSDIDNTILKAAKEGLTRQEVNDISRVYGIEFGEKAFSKLGEPLTSVNAQNFENTRKGLKGVARQGLGGAEAKALDAKLSDVLDAQTLVKKNMEAVNKLKQKVNERNILEKLGGKTAKAINAVTGNTLRGFVTGLFPSNVGNKAMNAIDIEQALQKNLSMIEKALNAKTENALIKNLKSLAVEIAKVAAIKGSVGLERAVFQQ